MIVKATEDSEAGGMPLPELLADMGAFNQALIDAGLFVGAGGGRNWATSLVLGRAQLTP